MAINYAYSTFVEPASGSTFYLKPDEVNIGDGETREINIQDATRTVVQITKLTAEIQFPGISLSQAQALETLRSNTVEGLIAGTASPIPLDMGVLQLNADLIGLGRSFPSQLQGQPYFEQPITARFSSRSYQ